MFYGVGLTIELRIPEVNNLCSVKSKTGTPFMVFDVTCYSEFHDAIFFYSELFKTSG